MNIFNKITLKGLQKNRIRTIVTIIGVILSASMITAVTTFISSLQNFMVEDEIARKGDWHVEFIEVDNTFIQNRIDDSKLRQFFSIQNIGYTMAGEGHSNSYFFIAGFDDAAYNIMPLQVVSGRFPENSSEIMLPNFMRNYPDIYNSTGRSDIYGLGDQITLSIGNHFPNEQQPAENEVLSAIFVPEFTRSFTIVGFCEKPFFDSPSVPVFTLITKADAEIAGNNIDKISYSVFAALKSPRTIYDYAENTAAGYEYRLNNSLLRVMGISDIDSFNAFLYSLGSIIIALIMIGSILLIYNSFAISVSERSRQFGILTSVGATSKQLRKSVLFEGLCVGIIGIPLGIIAGIGGIAVTLSMIGNFFNEMVVTGTPITLKVSFPAVIIAAAVGILTILISAYIPAGKASKRSAIESIRLSADIKMKAKEIKTSKPVKNLFGLEGMLALKNFKRNKKRYRSTVISLFVSIVLFISASTFAKLMSEGTDATFLSFGYDLQFYSSELDDETVFSLYDEFKDADGIYESGYATKLSFITEEFSLGRLSERYQEAFIWDSQISDKASMGFQICFVDDETYDKYLKDLGLLAEDYTTYGTKLVAVAKTQGFDQNSGRFTSFDIFKEKNDFSMQIEMPPFDVGNPVYMGVSLTIADKMPGIISDSQYSGFIAFAPYSRINEFLVDSQYRQTTVFNFRSNDAMKSAAAFENIIQEKEITEWYNLFNIAQLLASQNNILMVINVFTYGFVILISLITIANVFNTISTSVSLRRREFAMLRSVGLTDSGFRSLMNYECLFYGIKALLYGLPVSLVISYLIYQSVSTGVDIPFSLPWGSIGISIFSVFFIVFITMLYSMTKIKNTNIIDALRDDLA